MPFIISCKSFIIVPLKHTDGGSSRVNTKFIACIKLSKFRVTLLPFSIKIA